MSDQTRFLLNESDLPKFWYNVMADSRSHRPGSSSGYARAGHAGFSIGPVPMDLILQEVSNERYIEIPEEVREIYKLYRPTPLHRAHRLEKALGTPAHIYYKYEGAYCWNHN